MGDNIIVQRAQIWWGLIPFAEGTGAKDRPVVIVGCSPPAPRSDAIVLIMPIHTFGGDSTKAKIGDIRVPNPAGCGLDPVAASFVRARRMSALQMNSIDFGRGQVGNLDTPTMAAAIQEFTNVVTCGMGTYRK